NPIFGGASVTAAISAEHFTVTSPVLVTDVRFLSTEPPGTYNGSIHWQFYTNNPGGAFPPGDPGSIVAEGETSAVTRTPTGNIAFPPYPEMVNDFSVGSVLLGPGTYWLGLHNGPLSQTTDPKPLGYLWEFGPPIDTLRFDTAPFDGKWDVFGNQLEFALFG